MKSRHNVTVIDHEILAEGNGRLLVIMDEELVGIRYNKHTKSLLDLREIRERDKLNIAHDDFTRTGMVPYADALEIQRFAYDTTLTILCEINYEFRNPDETLMIVLTLPDGTTRTGCVNTDTYPIAEYQFDKAPPLWPCGTYQLEVLPSKKYELHEVFILLLNMERNEEELLVRAEDNIIFSLTEEQRYSYIAIHFKKQDT